LPLALSGRRLVKKLEPFFCRGGLGRVRRFPLDHTNHVACRQPVKIIAGANLVLVGNRFRKGQLEFARNFGHTYDQEYSKDFVLVQSLLRTLTPRGVFRLEDPP